MFAHHVFEHWLHPSRCAAAHCSEQLPRSCSLHLVPAGSVLAAVPATGHICSLPQTRLPKRSPPCQSMLHCVNALPAQV